MKQIYLWHSINIIPAIAVVRVLDDDGIETHLELCWLGVVILVPLPFVDAKRAYTFEPCGPAWSRRRKKWYWLKRRG